MRKRCKEGHIGSNNTMPKDKVSWATGEFTEGEPWRVKD
jgi:hypothetical protein